MPAMLQAGYCLLHRLVLRDHYGAVRPQNYGWALLHTPQSPGVRIFCLPPNGCDSVPPLSSWVLLHLFKARLCCACPPLLCYGFRQRQFACSVTCPIYSAQAKPSLLGSAATATVPSARQCTA